MGRLKIRHAYLDLREMRVVFPWEPGKKLNVRKRMSNFRPDYPLLLQPCTVTNTFSKGCEVLSFRICKATTHTLITLVLVPTGQHNKDSSFDLSDLRFLLITPF